MKFKVIAAILALNVSCTTRTEVHLFSEAIDQPQLERTAVLLKSQGFAVSQSTLPVPPAISRHTIIFPEIVQDFSEVYAIEAAIAGAGFENIKLIYATEGNHHYSTNNIGVYLVNPESSSIYDTVDPTALGGARATNLTHIYFSECLDPKSEEESELSLYPGGAALLEEFLWDEGRSKEASVIHDGEWRQKDSSSVSLELYGKREMVFHISEYEGSNSFGPYSGLTLEKQSAGAESSVCNYTYRRYED